MSMTNIVEILLVEDSPMDLELALRALQKAKVANHIQVAYAPDAMTANRALVRKASMARALGMQVNLCGDPEQTLDRHQAAQYRA